MKREIYPHKKTFIKYDDKHYLLYLNEEIIEDYLPNDAEDESMPFTAYAYSGPEEDGSTKIKATEATYPQFVAGLIRTRYSADDVEAILLNYQSYSADDSSDENKQVKIDWDNLANFREQCKQIAAALLE